MRALYDNEMNALWAKALVALQPAGCPDPEENEMRLDGWDGKPVSGPIRFPGWRQQA